MRITMRRHPFTIWHFSHVAVGSDEEYTFGFGINAPVVDSGDYCTTSLTINGQDASSTFSKFLAPEFARYDEIKHSLSVYYAIPENKIQFAGIPEELVSLRFIEEDNDPLA